MFNEEKLKEKAKDTLSGIFNKIPSVTIEELATGTPGPLVPPDIVYEVTTEDVSRYMFVVTRTSGQPKIIRNAVNYLLRYMENYQDSYGMIAAPYITSRSMAVCEEAGLGIVDFAGNALIPFGCLYIRIEGLPNPYSKDRGLRSLYSPKASGILRVLLNHSISRAWKVEEIRDESNVSIGLVSNVRKLLDEREWIVDREIGFSLKDPEALLREWAQNYSYRKNRVREYYTLKSLPEIEAAISDTGNRITRAALTGFSAAARMAPAVRYQRAAAYLQSDVERVAGILDLKQVDSGANVMLLEPYDDGVFYGEREVDGAACVSPVQAYLDLKGFRGRGEEAAEMLYEQVIKKTWA